MERLKKINDILTYRIIRFSRYRLYVHLEKGIEINNNSLSLQDMIDILIEYSLSKIHWLDEDTCYLKTKLKSKQSYTLFPQARLALVLCKLYTKTGYKKYLKIAKGLCNYLVSKQETNGLFHFHRPSWIPKDEGIMTYLAIIALTSAYDVTKDNNFLKASILAGNTGRKILFKEHAGYIHTIGQDYWCVNVSAAAAYAYYQLYLITNNKKYIPWIQNGLKYVIDVVRDDGFFPYSKNTESIYITSYHAIDIYYLLHFLDINIKWIDYNLIQETIRKSTEALISLIRKDGSVIEKDLNCYSYVDSVASSIAVISKLEENNLLKDLIAYLSLFFNKKQMYLFIRNSKLYNGRYNDFHENICTEVLLWLVEAKTAS